MEMDDDGKFTKLVHRDELLSFNQLVFKVEKIGPMLKIWARLFFPNGYGVSVIRVRLEGTDEYISKTFNEDEWEVAILKGNESSSDLVEDLKTLNMYFNESKEGVSRIIDEVSALSPKLLKISGVKK